MQKFAYIDEFLYPTWREVLGIGIFFPILSALFLIFIFPVPARWVFEYARSEQRKLKEIQSRIDDETPLTREESRALKAALRKAYGDFERELDARNNLIGRLRQEVTGLETELRSTVTAKQNKFDEAGEILDPRAVALLRKIATAPDSMIDRSLLNTSANERDILLFQHGIDELVRLKMIIEYGSTLHATAQGRAYLVRLESGLELDRENAAQPKECKLAAFSDELCSSGTLEVLD